MASLEAKVCDDTNASDKKASDKKATVRGQYQITWKMGSNAEVRKVKQSEHFTPLEKLENGAGTGRSFW